MTPARTRSRRVAAVAVAGAALCCAVASPAAALQSPEPESLPASGPGSPLTLGNRLVLEVHFDRGALAARDDLRRAGAQVLDASRREQVVTVAARPGELKALGAVPGAEGPSRVLTPVTSATCGSVISEGDTQLAAAQARADFGVDGSGVTVGILSDSFDTDAGAPTHAAQDIASGDLPGLANPCGARDAGPASSTTPRPAPTRAAAWRRSSTTSPPVPGSPSPLPLPAKRPSPKTSGRWRPPAPR